MRDAPTLLIARRGSGASGDPWRWSGRCYVEDVRGSYVARVGATTDIESELFDLILNQGDVLIRLLVPGRRRTVWGAPQIGARTIRPDPNSPNRKQVACQMRGGSWPLGELLGRALPLGHLVTVEAWRPNMGESSEGQRREAVLMQLQADAAAFLEKRQPRETFYLTDVVRACGGGVAQAGIHLRRILQDYVARGVLSAPAEGYKRRTYVMRKALH